MRSGLEDMVTVAITRKKALILLIIGNVELSGKMAEVLPANTKLL